MNAVELIDIKKSFDGGSEFILKGLDLKIPKGSLTVIIGYSGTGKSVMLKHILGLIKPTSGQVNVFGKNLWEMSNRDIMKLRTNIGVLFQHAALFDDQNVIENVTFPLFEHLKGKKHQEYLEIASKKLVMSGIEEKHFLKLPSELSGGMRKRVALARALALDPEILIYDEPTTGLDPILTEMVDDLIHETHMREEGRVTSIIVSHDLMAAFRIGQYIVMLDKGKVLHSGKPEDFLNSDIALVKKFVEKGTKKKYGL